MFKIISWYFVTYFKIITTICDFLKIKLIKTNKDNQYFNFFRKKHNNIMIVENKEK